MIRPKQLLMVGTMLCATVITHAENAPELSVPTDGNIMIDYTSVHVPSSDKTYYEALAWNTETGESTLYYYDYDDGTFNAYGPSAQLPVPSIASGSGKVMIDYEAVYVPSSDKTYYEALTWNTETGKSELYYYSYSEESFVAYGSAAQLPTCTLMGSGGAIMMDYSSIHVPSSDKTYYEALMWNTATGKSTLYYYNYDDELFEAYGSSAQLPEFAYTGTGEVMMDYTAVYIPTSDKTYYEALVWNMSTGQSTLYYYDYDDGIFEAYGNSVQLPTSEFAGRGEVMMDYEAVYIPSSDKTYYEVLEWNTHTGDSKLYYYNYDEGGFTAYSDNVQLPKSRGGYVMMDYTAIHVPSSDKTYYETMVWDAVLGVNTLYYYDYDDGHFLPYGDSVQLPELTVKN